MIPREGDESDDDCHEGERDRVDVVIPREGVESVHESDDHGITGRGLVIPREGVESERTGQVVDPLEVVRDPERGS